MDPELAYYYSLPASILSILGCIFVILLYYFATPLRVYAFKLIFWMILFELIRTAFQSIPIFALNDSNTLCYYISPIILYSSISSLLWILSISISMYQVICLGVKNIEKYYKYWACFNFIYPGIAALIPFITNSYGVLYSVCGFDNKFSGIILRSILFYGTAWILIITMLIVYIKINSKANDKNSNLNNRALDMKKLYIYPIILIFCITPLTISRILEALNLKWAYFEFISNLVWNMHGFFNSIAYTFTKPVIAYLKFIKNRRKVDSFSALIY